jgi:predicted flap endonuclease-1-like 5' DNA nuclease
MIEKESIVIFLQRCAWGLVEARAVGIIKAFLACGLMLATVSAADSVEASNYYLEDLGRFEEAQVKIFKSSDIETTEQFLAATLTQRQRKVLSSKVKLTEAELLEFAKDCELMQITGVGPRASRLLRAAGITGVGDLSERDPPELLQRIRLVNVQQRLTQKNPTVSVVKYWIVQASKVPYRLR